MARGQHFLSSTLSPSRYFIPSVLLCGIPEAGGGDDGDDGGSGDVDAPSVSEHLQSLISDWLCVSPSTTTLQIRTFSDPS